MAAAAAAAAGAAAAAAAPPPAQASLPQTRSTRLVLGLPGRLAAGAGGADPRGGVPRPAHHGGAVVLGAHGRLEVLPGRVLLGLGRAIPTAAQPHPHEDTARTAHTSHTAETPGAAGASSTADTHKHGSRAREINVSVGVSRVPRAASLLYLFLSLFNFLPRPARLGTQQARLPKPACRGGPAQTGERQGGCSAPFGGPIRQPRGWPRSRCWQRLRAPRARP